MLPRSGVFPDVENGEREIEGLTMNEERDQRHEGEGEKDRKSKA